MPSCQKVKNPCKICLQAVSNKNGIQCRGACKKWAHFTCLNYTPGKIKDIKDGIITITCPCPDCLTEQPKETLTNPPQTCSNEKCPSNQKPTCEIPDCPSKKAHPIPSPPPLAIKPSPPKQPVKQRKKEPPCGPKPPCAESKANAPKTGQEVKLPKVSPMKPPCPVLHPCPSKEKKKPIRPQPCSCVDESSRDKKFPKTSSEGNMLPSDSLYVTVQDMCKTVGQLSTQLKQLMCKMMDSSPTA